MVVSSDVDVAPDPEARRAPPRLGYQPALDGLRAFAAITVLLYHGGATGVLSGGYLSIDVFFVLSGFLITSLLVTEWQRGGGIDIMRFYGRRIRRLFPALFLMLGAVIVYGATIAPQSQLRELRGDLLATIGYANNWRLIVTHRGYFDNFAAPSPLKHTWSLGLEEQWYLIWPIAVVGLLRLTRKPDRSLRAALGVTIALCLASTIWIAVLYHPGADPSRLYYGTDTRAQELLAGAVLAFLCAIAGRFTVPPRYRTLVNVAGGLALGWVVYLFLTVDTRTTWLYEGGLLLFSFVLALVVFAAVQPSGIVRRVLSPGPLRWLGLISYGLYLWHWPIYVVLTPTRMGFGGARLLALRLGLTVVVAAVSYYLVEQPIREGRVSKRTLYVSIPTVIIGSVIATLVVTSGAPVDPATAVAAAATTAGNGTGTYFAISPSAAQAIPPTRLALMGDSVALTLSLGFAQVTSATPTELSDHSDLGCSLFPGNRILGDGQIDSTVDGNAMCAPFRADRARWLPEYQPEVVAMLSGTWDVYDRVVDGHQLTFGSPAFDQWFSTNLDALITQMSSTGARVAILTAPCNNRDEGISGEVPPENQGSRIDALNQLYRQAVERNPQHATLIDLHGLLCPGGKYLDRLDGVQLRSDGVHFTREGAVLTWKWLLPRLQALSGH